MQLLRGTCQNRYCVVQALIQSTNQQIAETVSKYKQTDTLKKILTVHDECTMTCVKCYKQFNVSQDQVMALMLSGLQVECGKCNEPSTTTVDG